MSAPRTRALIRCRPLLASLLVGGAACLAAPVAAQGLTHFRSPSGNIGCVMTKGSVRCDIAERSWAAPAKPRSCELDYGHGIALAKRGKARFICAGDTTLGAKRVLAYGKRARVGRFTCRSRTSGMRCATRGGRHGFLLARERYRLW